MLGRVGCNSRVGGTGLSLSSSLAHPSHLGLKAYEVCCRTQTHAVEAVTARERRKPNLHDVIVRGERKIAAGFMDSVEASIQAGQADLCTKRACGRSRPVVGAGPCLRLLLG